MKVAVGEFLTPRCIDDGGCLIWDRAVNTSGNPVASIAGVRSTPVRRWVWSQEHGNLREGLRVIPSCGRLRCVAPGCLRAVTPTAVNQAIAARGGFATPAFRKARRDAGRAQSTVTLADVRDMRRRRFVDNETLASIAADYPISLSRVSVICRGEAWPDPAGNPFSGLAP